MKEPGMTDSFLLLQASINPGAAALKNIL